MTHDGFQTVTRKTLRGPPISKQGRGLGQNQPVKHGFKYVFQKKSDGNSSSMASTPVETNEDKRKSKDDLVKGIRKKVEQRCVWDVEIDSKDSWGWKCLLNLRSWVGNHMRYKIGDGKSISVWYDKWNSVVSLSSMISKKEIFYAGFKDQDKIQDVLDDNRWKWPQNWKDKYPWITNIQTPYITNQPDQAIWVDNNGKEKRFSTNTVWKDVRGNHEEVNWYKIVWHSNCIPKHTFLLWIAARNKLCTQDRMGKWYPNKVFTCSLCKKFPDSHEHLFFKCEYAQKVWKMVCNIAKLDLKENKWDKILESNDNNSI
ncbi:RNA-directed DNA polymerase, eukaryota, reverse transcriptase zinc-binding domain protein [Tanacetum coccineum]